MNFDNILLMKQGDFMDVEESIVAYLSDNREKFVEWAKNNNSFFNPDIYTSERMFSLATKHLINDKYGKYDDSDIKYLIYYFSQVAFKKLGMDGIKTNISYEKLFTDYAAASYDYDNKEITFYMNKFDVLKGENPDLIDGLMLVFYEVNRANQENRIRSKNINFDINDYMIAMETINVHNTHGFYANNYEKLIRDNMSGMFAFGGIYESLMKFKPDIKELNDSDYFDFVVNSYNDNINENSLLMYGLEGDRFKQLDYGTRHILSIKPSLVLKYPILLFGFDISGKKKDMIALSSDYDKLIELIPDKKESIDKFYKTLIMERHYLDDDYDTLKSDVKTLESFLRRKRPVNKFYADLYTSLKEKYDYSENVKKYVNTK